MTTKIKSDVSIQCNGKVKTLFINVTRNGVSLGDKISFPVSPEDVSVPLTTAIEALLSQLPTEDWFQLNIDIKDDVAQEHQEKLREERLLNRAKALIVRNNGLAPEEEKQLVGAVVNHLRKK